MACEGRAPYAAAGPERVLGSDTLDHLRAAVVALTAQVPDRADGEAVASWLAGLRGVEGAVAGLRAALVACAQRSRAEQPGGHASTASLLREQLGLSAQEAGRQDALARDLRQLPGTRAALQAGDLGAEQAQAIGQAARRGVPGSPAATEAQLLPTARSAGADELRREIRAREAAADHERLAEDERLAHRRRRASVVRREDGMWDLYARLTGEVGEALATALEAHRTFDPPDTPLRERRTPEQRTADAFAGVVQAALGGRTPTKGGVRPRVSIVVPVERLLAETASAAERPAAGPHPPEPSVAAHGVPPATTASGDLLSDGLLQRLLCDADLRAIVRGGTSRILDVGRTRSTWSVAQRQALWVRDGGCRGPGCDRPAAWCDAHHIVWWTKGGRTSLDNGILLCRTHHRLVHEGGWSLRLDPETGRARFRGPDGRVVETVPHGVAATGRAPP